MFIFLYSWLSSGLGWKENHNDGWFSGYPEYSAVSVVRGVLFNVCCQCMSGIEVLVIAFSLVLTYGTRTRERYGCIDISGRVRCHLKEMRVG
jgi:hypothetical protein